MPSVDFGISPRPPMPAFDRRPAAGTGRRRSARMVGAVESWKPSLSTLMPRSMRCWSMWPIPFWRTSGVSTSLSSTQSMRARSVSALSKPSRLVTALIAAARSLRCRGPGPRDGQRDPAHQVRILFDHRGVRNQRIAPEVEAEIGEIEQRDILELQPGLHQVEDDGVVEADDGIDLALDQHGVAQLDVDRGAVDRLDIDLVEREQCRQDLRAGIHAAGADAGADHLLQGLDRLALEAEHDGGKAVEHGHDELRRFLRVARGELDQRAEIGEAERMRAGGDARDRLDRSARAVHGDVDALVAENPALGAEKERRIAAVDAKFQAETDRLRGLPARHLGRHDEQA